MYEYGTKIYRGDDKPALTLLEHSNEMNAYLEKENGWKPHKVSKLGPGRWGTDINICRIAYALEHTTTDSSIEDVASAVHDGWALCYEFWYTNKPWTINSGYIAPGKDLTVREKLARSKLKYGDLDEYQKNICRQMAKYIMKECM